MAKVLPFCDTPIIKTYPYIAFYLGVLQSRGVDISDFIIKEFSHIFFFRGKLDFSASGFFHKKYFYYKPNKYSLMKNINNIKREIDNNHYIIAILNEKHVSNDSIFLDFDYYHDWIIYGYDDIKKELYCAGYYGENLKLRRYGTKKITYGDVESALKNSCINRYTLTTKDTHTMWLKKFPTVQMNTKCIISILEKFISPPIIAIYHRPVINLDCQAIECLICYINKLIDDWEKIENKTIWLQSFRVLYEHINVLKIIERKYVQNTKIHNELETVYADSYSLLLTVGKYNMKPDKQYLKKIEQFLRKICKKEENVIRKMIITLKQNIIEYS